MKALILIVVVMISSCTDVRVVKPLVVTQAVMIDDSTCRYSVFVNNYNLDFKVRCYIYGDINKFNVGDTLTLRRKDESTTD